MNEKNIGKIINKLREEKGITQKELADRLKISDKAISKWETGINLPNIDMIYKISTIFKVSFQNLLKVRLEDEHVDEKIIKDIMDEFNETNRRKTKIIKIAFSITIIFALILLITMIFTHSYNKFKVYNVWTSSKQVIIVNGIYVETRIKDSFLLNNIKIKNKEIGLDDNVSVDIYILENDEKKVIYTASSLKDVNFSNYQTYIKIDDLTKYIDNLYIRVIITDSKNKTEVFEDKLEFKIDFSNNKIYEEGYTSNFNGRKLENRVVKELLLDNGFKETSDNTLVKRDNKLDMIYYYDSNKLYYIYEKNNLSYRYAYYFDLMNVEILIFDENNTEIENYEYDAYNDKVISCNIGSCNNYDTAMKLLNEDILDYLYNS